MSSTNRHKKHFIPNFEARSVLLVVAMTFGGVAGAQGQTTAPISTASASAAAEGIPLNRSSTSDANAAFDRADTKKDGKLGCEEA